MRIEVLKFLRRTEEPFWGIVGRIGSHQRQRPAAERDVDQPVPRAFRTAFALSLALGHRRQLAPEDFFIKAHGLAAIAVEKQIRCHAVHKFLV